MKIVGFIVAIIGGILIYAGYKEVDIKGLFKK